MQEIGSEVTLFQPGDEVYYAGDITRSGTNAEFQLVDERIVGDKPKSLSYAEAAALPLTTITAYEAYIDVSAAVNISNKVGLQFTLSSFVLVKGKSLVFTNSLTKG